MFRCLAGSLILLWACILRAQSTEGIILGTVYDEGTGRPIVAARLLAVHTGTHAQYTAISSGTGWYSLPSLSPGTYFVRATADGYQGRETNQIELAVSGRMQINLPLRYLLPNAKEDNFSNSFVGGSAAFVHTYAADLQATRLDLLTVPSGLPGVLESSLSYVISPSEIERLPLSGRDLYTALALQPEVNSYSGTARGLALTVAGQRPSAINYLLDGVENNNHLTSGPLTNVAPESMQEYRVSTHNYSAEFGRTSGAIANTVSRSGLDGWHALFYSYLKNAALNAGLNANDFQRITEGYERAPIHELETGTYIGGPLTHEFFVSVPLDFLRYRSRNAPQDWLLPTRQFIESVWPDRTGGSLLRTYGLAVAPAGPGDSQKVAIASPVEIDRYSGVPRLDFLPARHQKHRVFARVAFSVLRQPGLFASPYPDLSAPFRQNGTNVSIGYTFVPKSSVTNEFRFAYGADSTRVDRVHSELPFSVSTDQTALPGSPAAFTFHNSGRSMEILDNFSIISGRSVWKFGAGLLRRNIVTFADVLAAGQYQFDSLAMFANDQPSSLLLTYDRSKAGEIGQPPFDREYRHSQFYLFAQQSTNVTRRLQINIGLRYEYFSAPQAAGQGRDYLLDLGGEGTIQQRLADASWHIASDAVYSSRPGNLAVRGGLAFDLTGSGSTFFRLGYGLYYDRPFENVWQTIQANRMIFGFSHFVQNEQQQTVNILQPAIDIARKYPPDNYDNPLDPVTFQRELRNPAVQHLFAALQHRVPGAGFLEVAWVGSLASGLLTTDKINRPFSNLADRSEANPLALINSSLPLVSYRGNQGKSNYHALTTTWRFLTPRVRGQASYTWSHSIDVQSDPLAGEFLNFNFFNAQTAQDLLVATFTRQFDSQSDRGNSDFDQRHSFVLYGVADVPPAFSSAAIAPVFRNWQVAATGAIRSGFPYTVYANVYEDAVEQIYNNRADLKDSASARVDVALPRGRRLLNPDAFAPSDAFRIGTSGRNAFSGPGLISFDASLARTFSFRKWERARATLRADAYNVLNHANLNNPESTKLGSPQFGVAQYGREEKNSGFPLLTPFRETSRTIQLMLRVQF